MTIIALEYAVQTLSETANVRLNVLEPAMMTRFFVLMTPELSIENSSEGNRNEDSDHKYFDTCTNHYLSKLTTSISTM